MDRIDDNQKDRLYVVCSNCGYEAVLNENEKEIICPSCGSRITVTQQAKGKETIPEEHTEVKTDDRQSDDSQEKPYSDFVMEDRKLVHYRGKESHVTVPGLVNQIGPAAFAGCKQIQTVYLPDSVNVIPERAFEGCDGLEHVKLPENLYKIGASAFKGCEKLKDLELPASVKVIESGAFSGVNNLNYKNLFIKPIQYGTTLSIADQQLESKFQNAVKAQRKEREKPKNMKRGLVFAIAAVILLVLGSAIKRNNDFSNQMKLADSYLQDGSYEKAIEAYHDALDIKQSHDEVTKGLNTVYVKWGDSLLADHQYEEAIEKYNYLPDSHEYIDEVYKQWGDTLKSNGNYAEAVLKYGQMISGELHLEETYTEWADSYASKSDYEEAVKVLEEGRQLLSENSYSTYELDDEIEEMEFKAELKSKLVAIAKKIKSQKIEDALNAVDELNGDYQNIYQNLNGQFPFIVSVENAEYGDIGIHCPYSDTFSIYHGEYSGSSREGEGYYLYRYKEPENIKDYEYTFGQWKNDKPNGKQSRRKWFYENGKLTYDVRLTSNVTDGVFDGDVEWKDYISGGTYYGKFDDGYFVVLNTEIYNGDTYYNVLRAKDGTNLSYVNGKGLDGRWCIFDFN